MRSAAGERDRGSADGGGGNPSPQYGRTLARRDASSRLERLEAEWPFDLQIAMTNSVAFRGGDRGS
jgi:hypothetical protein